ncbi:MAG: hypothetical protein ACK5MP_05315 [Nostocoides sp.]
MVLAKRVIGGLLGLVGIGALVLGSWFIAHVGTSGTATFTVATTGDEPVVIPAQVSARLTVPATITATASKGTEVWVGRGGASDVAAALGTTAVTTVTAVDIPGWQLRTRSSGSGDPAALSSYDIWRSQSRSMNKVVVAVPVDEHPPTIVIATKDGGPTQVTMSWTRSRWFFQALTLSLIGLLLVAVGVSFLLSKRLTAGGDGDRDGTAPAHAATDRSDLAGQGGADDGSTEGEGPARPQGSDNEVAT